MNLAIGRTATRTFKDLMTQHVSLACGLAVAASAVLAFGGTGANDRPVVQAARTAVVRPGISHAGSQPHVVFYLAPDQASVDKVHASEALEWLAPNQSSVAEPNRSVIVFKVGTQEEMARAQHHIYDAMAAGNFSVSNPAPSFTVVDLR
jgi:hypothetical protein